ncbi:uncharacterized protein YndB with AHSA1/START domain [Actinopolyspora lacussalsi]|nr:uncharacterized protein YndB with AHSA1/START domain [Actinopolyspora lacussalsi]
MVLEPAARAELEMAVPPELVYRMLTDLDVLAEVSEELESCTWLDESSPRPGVRFRGFNRNGDKTWSTVATVRVAESGQCFAFDVDDGDTPVSHWRFELSSTDAGCLVVESAWDRRPAWYTPVSADTTGEAHRQEANQRNIERTLHALRAAVERG